MILRRLSPDDWLLWREVRLRALEDSPDAFGATLSEWSAAGEDRWRSRLGTVPFNVVAVLGDDPVGQASGTELGDDGRVELVSMWVAPDARATQVAGGLVEAVAGWASGVGAQALRLSVRSSNARAIGFYRRLGFDEVDEAGDEASEIAMIRPLDG